MSAATFDALGYMRRLEESGVPRQQAETQADALRQVLEKYDEAERKGLATKADVHDLRLEIEKVRSEIKMTELRLLRWYIGGWIALAMLMIKGFHWFGF